jgi:hypothetical protein
MSKNENWRETLGLVNTSSGPTASQIRDAFIAKCHTEHPDKGGSDDRFRALLDAKKQADDWLASTLKPAAWTGRVDATNKATKLASERWSLFAMMPPDYTLQIEETVKIANRWSMIFPWPTGADGHPLPWGDVEIVFDAGGAPVGLGPKIAKIAAIAGDGGFPVEILGPEG